MVAAATTPQLTPSGLGAASTPSGLGAGALTAAAASSTAACAGVSGFACCDSRIVEIRDCPRPSPASTTSHHAGEPLAGGSDDILTFETFMGRCYQGPLVRSMTDRSRR